jgi:hypothetical protein
MVLRSGRMRLCTIIYCTTEIVVAGYSKKVLENIESKHYTTPHQDLGTECYDSNRYKV